MDQHPNIQLDLAQIPVPGSVSPARQVARQDSGKVKALVTMQIDKWESQEDFDRGLAPMETSNVAEVVEVDRELLNAARSKDQ